jgi:diguanylate cyclase (GGDEF)-like protein/PAS domain S-box-containing protein
MNKRRFIYSLSVILLLIVAVAGWFATDYLGKKARQEIIRESQASALTLSIYVSSTLTNIEGAVKSLAGSPWIAPALMPKRDHQDIDHANSALDRYNSALNSSVSYLMDADGMTVASSNRKDSDSFVGKSYRFRPYFQEAAKGQPGRYFALGITSGKRGFYASYPVRNRPGEVVGVVTMKKDLDEMETFFSKYLFCFLISPDGIVFLSSSPVMVLKSLWPLDKAVRDTLIASQQFGIKLSEAVMKKEIADGTEVTLEGKDYLVSRKVLNSDGWSIVLLTPTDQIRLYKWFGILATISVGFLIMVFSGIIYVSDRSQEAIRQSEESKRVLLDAVGDGIFGVDATGQVTFINPGALRMLGFAVEEMLGQSVHILIHHSRGDGSNYPVEDCPMYASFTQAADSHVADEVLWRKDGSSFPVEYSSMPITKDGKVVGAVVTFKDITERKQSEEKIRQMAYHDSLTGLPNRTLFFDRLGVALAQAQRNQKGIAITMLDLDHFKDVNDTLGHDVGDLLLKAAAERLSAALRKGDTVARFGGDEFVLILPDLKGIADAIQVAQKIVNHFRKPFLIDTHQLVVTTSIGITVYPDDGMDEGILLKNADIAMYQAKQAGRNRYQLWKKI